MAPTKMAERNHAVLLLLKSAKELNEKRKANPNAKKQEQPSWKKGRGKLTAGPPKKPEYMLWEEKEDEESDCSADAHRRDGRNRERWH